MLGDAERLSADIDLARRLGFGGKLCIHPSQVDPVNRGFLPSEREVAWARKVLEVVTTAGGGAARIDGEMVDRAVIERAKAILARAHSK